MDAETMTAAKRLRDAIEMPITVAVDRALDRGWPVERMSIVHDETRGTTALALEIDRGRPHWPVFEVSMTFDLRNPSGAQAIVTERWLTEIPEAA